VNGEQIMTLVFLALLGAFIAFYRYSRTEAWERSETRTALLNVIVAVGPLLGMHYKPPRPPLPGIMTPGPDADPGADRDDGEVSDPAAPGAAGKRGPEGGRR